MKPVVMCVSESIEDLNYDLLRICSLMSSSLHIRPDFTKDQDYGLSEIQLHNLNGGIEPFCVG